jgi:L-seryl-tRNA(Ser) seleniumtransferase
MSMPAKRSPGNERLRNLPSVDDLLRSDAGRSISAAAGQRHASTMARAIVAQLRSRIAGDPASTEGQLLDTAVQLLADKWDQETRSAIRRVINATGVVIHTNLGRSPLSEAAVKALADEASGYCSLEFDLSTGKRGPRGRRAEELIAELTGADDALIVNNCAAAAFFVLTVFASGGEVIISRGEMVEIGGDFRVPDVLTQSGCVLSEVGTTNRTKLADYQRAINANTRAILRVHPSNYRIVGFTASPSLGDLSSLAKKSRLLLYEDLGSGALNDLSAIGLADEPVAARSIADGADIITFSGDKLLGGPQAGIIAGSKKYVSKLRKHPLYRALRVDKLIYAALEATLESHRRGSGLAEVPTLTMLSANEEELDARAARFIDKVNGLGALFKAGRSNGISAVGGGAAPAVELKTVLISLSHPDLSAAQLEAALRAATPPLITRVARNAVLLDLRTVSGSEELEILAILAGFART